MILDLLILLFKYSSQWFIALLTQLLIKMDSKFAKCFSDVSDQQKEKIAVLERAYSAYCSGSMRTDTEVDFFLTSWMRDTEDSISTLIFIIDIFITEVNPDPSNHKYRQRCRCCARIVSAIHCEEEVVHEHPAYAAAIYAVKCMHPYLFKEILLRLLLGSFGREVINKADLFTQLAVAFDLLDAPKRAETLLRHVQTMSRTGSVRPQTADFGLRLLAIVNAWQGKIATALLLYTEAAAHAEVVYGLSPLQVDIAWTLAICRTSMNKVDLPRLIDVVVAALEHIVKRSPASEDLVKIDMLMHGLNRGRYRYLSVLSCMTTLRIMHEAPPLDLDNESLAITYVNMGNAMLQIEALNSDWNLMARHFFEELIQQVNSNNITSSESVQYQVAHAFAGIGFSYWNIAKTTEGDERRALYGKTKQYLDQAIELFQQFHQDYWIEARVWAVAGSVEAVYGRINDMHKRFSAALLSGATHYQINVENLIYFFNPDEDVRLKYSESLANVGLPNAAIVLAKAAVHSIHHNADPRGDMADLSLAYIGSRTLAHRTLINEFSKVGRYNEGELAYDLLKENEYNEFTRRSTAGEDVAHHIAFTSFELEAIKKLGLGAITSNVKRLELRAEIIDRLAASFTHLNSTIQDLIDSKRFSKDHNSIEVDYFPNINLGRNDAVLRFISSGSSLLISFSAYEEKKQLVVPIEVQILNTLIFEFRQECRSSSLDITLLYTLGQQLYRILFEPIEDIIANNITHLYIEADHLLANIPFAALYDGQGYLIERFSLIYLNKFPLNTDVRMAEYSTKHAAIFACTNIPGDELPGAALEASIVSKKLGILPVLELDCYLDQECTVESFLREIVRPRGGQGLIHLATHASFNPWSDESSILAFTNEILSIRDLREILEESGCDTALFVLSACGTARNDIDIDGFSSVLLRSGVKTVLSALWETYDNSAPEFFDLLYDNIKNFSSTSDIASATRVAQLALLKHSYDNGSRFAHPVHWAPYVVTTAQIS